MKKQSNAPQIRFQNFEDEWIDSTIGRHISLLNGRAYKQEELLDEGKYKVLRVGNFNTNSKWYYSNLELEENKYVNKGDLLYLWATNFGPEIWTEEKAIYHYHIWKLDFDRTEINQDYLNIWLESDKNKIQQNTNGSTMVHITKSMMEERGISLPNFDEQSAIGFLFRTLDDLLASYKDNLASYQSLKATMLSRMFPKAGQTVPEIRLDGFEGEWEVQTLKELASFSKGNGYTKNDLVNSGKEIILYGRLYTNYQTLISQVNTFVTKVKANAVISKGGEVIVPASGESAEDISRASVVEKSGVILGGDLNIIYPDENKVDSIFLALTISNGSQQKELIKRAQGKSVVHLRNNDLEKVVLHYPSMEEQRAIGSYFANLDNLITSYQEKISQLETLKKKLLQGMFV